MSRYAVEFLLSAGDSSIKEIKSAIAEFADSLIITEQEAGQDKESGFKIQLCTDEPTLVFDACGQIGRIKAVKIDEIQQGQRGK